MNQKLKRVLIGVGAAFLLIQFYPISHPNPEVVADLAAPADVKAILRRSCYDCHSNETQWPLYSWVAPVSWLVTKDVEDGRAELNFSIWGRYDDNKRLSKASSLVEEIEDQRMPPKNYLLLHPGARVSPDELEVLRRWADEIE